MTWPSVESLRPPLAYEPEVVGEALGAVGDLDAVRRCPRTASRDPGLHMLVEDVQGEVDLLEAVPRVVKPGRAEQAGEFLAVERLREDLALLIAKGPVPHPKQA